MVSVALSLDGLVVSNPYKQTGYKNFKELYDSNKRQVYWQALKIVRNNAAAEDITQDVFLRVFRKLGNFSSEYLFTNWIYVITRNTAINYIRRNKKTKELTDNIPTYDNPEVIAISRDMRDKLRRAIKKLNKNQRAVLELVVDNSVSYKEAARILGMSYVTAGTRKYRGKLKLIELMQ